jgi:hypothetical protein
MTSESSMIKAIKRKAGTIPGVKIKKLWSSAANRDLDLFVTANGLACVYEIKIPGEQPTPWQINKMDQWRASAYDVDWFDDVDKCVSRIKNIAACGKTMRSCYSQWIDQQLGRIRISAGE